MNKNVLIIGAVGLAAAAYLYLGQDSLGGGLSGGGGGPSGGPSEIFTDTKKDESTGGGGTTVVFPADTFTGFPAAGGVSLEDLLKALAPPVTPVPAAKKELTSAEANAMARQRQAGWGGQILPELTPVDTGTGLLQGFLDFFGSGEILRQASGTSSSNALAGKGGSSGGGFGGFGGLGKPVSLGPIYSTKSDTPLNKKDEGMAVSTGAGTAAYTLADPFYSTDPKNYPATSAASVYNIPSSGVGTLLGSGNIVVPQSGTGKGAGVVLLSPTGQFLAGGSAGATTAALERTAGMEAAAQASARASNLASGYFVNSKGGLQKGPSSTGGKK